VKRNLLLLYQKKRRKKRKSKGLSRKRSLKEGPSKKGKFGKVKLPPQVVKVFPKEKPFDPLRWNRVPYWARSQRVHGFDNLSYRLSRDLCELHDYTFSMIMIAYTFPSLRSKLKRQIKNTLYSFDFNHPTTLGAKALSPGLGNLPNWLRIQFLKVFQRRTVRN
jgi:hypothetical protein